MDFSLKRILMNGTAAFAAIALVAACNQNKGKEITSEQEDKLNRSDKIEKDNAKVTAELLERAKKAEDQEKALDAKKEELEKRAAELAELEATRIANAQTADARESNIAAGAQEIAAGAQQLEQDRLALEEEKLRNQNERVNVQMEMDKLKLMAGLIGSTSKKANLLKKLADGKKSAIMFIVLSSNDNEYSSIKKTISETRASTKEAPLLRDLKASGGKAGVFIAQLDSSEQMKTITDSALKLTATSLDFHEVDKANLRVRLKIVYTDHSEYVTGLNDLKAFDLGANLSKISKIEFGAATNMPDECRKAVIDGNCLLAFNSSLDLKAAQTNVSLRELIASELRLSIANRTGKPAPKLAYELKYVNKNRVVDRIALTTEILVQGPSKSEGVTNIPGIAVDSQADRILFNSFIPTREYTTEEMGEKSNNDYKKAIGNLLNAIEPQDLS